MWKKLLLLLAISNHAIAAFYQHHRLDRSPSAATTASHHQHHPKCGWNYRVQLASLLRLSSIDDIINDDDDDDDEEEDEDEEVEPGKMRVSEIKAELDLRGYEYKDCFDKESLTERLQEARATGKADPTILEKFNKQKLEETFKEQKLEVKDEDIEKVVAGDGKLPGGMSPDTFKKLVGNPEIMALLQSTKMQEAMSLMMTGGREELEKKLQKDPELRETVAKLDAVLQSGE